MKKAKREREGSFHSKILLFGEYGIIQNSMGLSIPYESFKGKLAYQGETSPSPNTVTESNASLRRYADYLKTLQDKGELFAEMDLVRLFADIEKGIYFESSIPQGFGVGSSGALVAALYDEYAINKVEADSINKKSLKELKRVFSQMESYFHGTSSGMDPLICYIDLPVLIKSKTNLDTVILPEEKAGQGAIFLIDTGRPGRTQPLVQYFLERCEQPDFRAMCREKFIPYNDQCIKDFLKGETKSLFANLYHLSYFLLENLEPMVPKLFRDVWKRGLDSGAYYLKLCGSGGGGFILGFTEDLEKAKEHLGEHQIKVIKRF